MTEPEAALALLRQKLDIMRDVLAVSRDCLLLVDLEGLTPLLERKDGLLREVQLIDEALAGHESLPAEAETLRKHMIEVVESILENERTLEARMEKAYAELRREARSFEQETQLKQYLERARLKGGTVNLKK